ncbi:uncharacterized protein LOC132755901 [Ruditapes philippinarum]|uniref:uncharacterized protein LOC132755901 n=1 Tax=Ruditapes philippinarum TaxID=129788 RepID=UPI00295A6DE8|nr:uncharacterized protein LOC132755901 [Ruditapes philippinarum]
MEIRKPKVDVRGPYRSYDAERLTEAYIAVKENAVSIRKASALYGVPKTTLIDRLSGKVHVDCVTTGAPTLFAQEQEALLARHIKTMAEVGYGYSRQETINLASDFAVSLGLRDRNHPLTDRWLYQFIRRWPELNIKKPRSLDMARARRTTREAIDCNFDALNNIMVKYHLLAKPHLTYNVDEKGLNSEHKPPKIVSGKHHKVQAVTSGRSKTVTVIGCVNAVGQQVPPYFVFPGARMIDSLMEGATPGSSATVTQSGWSNTEIFSTNMKDHLLKYLPPRSPEAPVLVLYDGHKSHVALDLIQWAKAENIILFVLPPHCSHLLQPLDVSCFGPFEIAWNAACHRHMRESGGSIVTRYEVARLACKIYASTLTPSNIQSAFKRCGVFPFNRNAVSDLQVAPLTTFDRDQSGQDERLKSDNVGSSGMSDAEHFLEKREGQILENVQKAKTKRNTLSKIVGGIQLLKITLLNKSLPIMRNMTQSKKANKLPKTKLKLQIRNPPNLEHLEFQLTKKEKLILLLKIVVTA